MDRRPDRGSGRSLDHGAPEKRTSTAPGGAEVLRGAGGQGGRTASARSACGAPGAVGRGGVALGRGSPLRPALFGAQGARLKVAEFTVRASAAQSANWKRAASAEGFPSVGGWLAHAADAQLRAIVRGGLPMPLGWVKGFFRVVLLDGRELPEVWGKVSPPFAIYQGDPAGPNHREPRTLVYLKTGAIIATLRTAR